MNLPYRTRRILRRFGIFLLTAAVIFALVWLCWVIWLQRYVVYTRDGAVLDFSRSAQSLSGVEAREPTQGATVGIYYNEGENLITPDNSLTQISGVYADTAAILADQSGVASALRARSEGAVMLDVKSIYGNFFYSTGISGASSASGVDVSAMDGLIRDLNAKGLYTIARVPAFRDRSFGLNNTSSGLPTEEGYLWEDDEGCYWLNPADSGTITYLVRIATELRELGFREVVFTEFAFPDTDQVVISSEGTKAEILAKAASDLVSACAAEGFAVSFASTDPTLAIPAGRSRLYLMGVDASAAASVAAQTTVEDKQVNLVFLADTNDTRFDSYSVLRALSTEG